jgi:hypothetical protein
VVVNTCRRVDWRTQAGVSLWYLLRTDATTVISYDEDEFAAIRWLTLPQVLAEPADTPRPAPAALHRKAAGDPPRHSPTGSDRPRHRQPVGPGAIATLRDDPRPDQVSHAIDTGPTNVEASKRTERGSQ